jgi:hypothetical protein
MIHNGKDDSSVFLSNTDLHIMLTDTFTCIELPACEFCTHQWPSIVLLPLVRKHNFPPSDGKQWRLPRACKKTGGRLLVCHKTRLSIAPSDSRQWTSYTVVYPSPLCLTSPLLLVRSALSGLPLNGHKPAKGSWRLCRNRLHSFYRRWMESTAVDDC